MLDNLEVRKSIVSWLLANSTVTSTLNDINEIREMDWQGEKFTYPNIRVTSSVSPNECEFSDVDGTISFFSEEKSSRQSIKAQGIIAKQLHKKNFISEGVRMSAILITQLPDAVQVEEDIWKADVILSMKASSE